MEKKVTFINHQHLVATSEAYSDIGRVLGLQFLRMIGAEIYLLMHADDHSIDWYKTAGPQLWSAWRAMEKSEADLLSLVADLKGAHRVEAVFCLGTVDGGRTVAFTLRVRCFAKHQRQGAKVPTMELVMSDRGRYESLKLELA